MRVRQPEIDFSHVEPRWGADGEFAQSFNALSTVPAYLEPYLIVVVRRAREKLGPGDEALLADTDVLIKQEAQHFKFHRAYNKHLREAGNYTGMLALERRYEAIFERLLKRSLRFNLAYAEGFEALGSASAEFWVDHAQRVVSGIDPATLELWRWHFAEEYEHRTVCYRLYHRLYGHGPTQGYVTRVATFLYALWHIDRHTTRVTKYLVSEDQKHMSPAEVAASKERARTATRNRRKSMRTTIRRVVRPSYDPADLPAPRLLADALDAY